MLLWISEAGEMDVKQIYGRNDMVMLEQHNKIYGSLGIEEQTILKTVEGNPAVLENPKPGVAEDVITGFKMQGWTEQDGTPTPEAPVPIVSAGTQNQDTGKWEYEIEVTGANLFNPEKLTGGEIVEYNGVQCYKYIDNSTNFTYIDDFSENTQYCFSVMVLSSEGNEEKIVDIKIWYTDGITTLIKSPHNQLASIVSSANKTVDKITGSDNWSVTRYINLSITTLGIGTEPLPYQPYKEQTVTLTSDRPLTKWDKLEKRNGQWGWVYKSEKIETYTDESVPGEYFSTTGQLSTGAQVWYETTTETFVPISESEQEQMNALEMYLPTTVITNDVDCNMIVTYKATQNGGESE